VRAQASNDWPEEAPLVAPLCSSAGNQGSFLPWLEAWPGALKCPSQLLKHSVSVSALNSARAAEGSADDDETAARRSDSAGSNMGAEGAQEEDCRAA